MNEQQRLTQNIKMVVTAYQAVRPIALATVSRLFFNDGKFLDQIMGADPPAFLITKYDNGLEKLSKEWPEGAVWPPTVERPPLRPARASA